LIHFYKRNQEADSTPLRGYPAAVVAGSDKTIYPKTTEENEYE